MANVARHDETTTNHAEVLTEDHWGIETFFGLSDDNTLDVLQKVQLVEEVQVRHVLNPDVGYCLDIYLPNREFPTLTSRVDVLKSEVGCLEGRQDVIGVQKHIWSRIIVIVNHNTLTMENRNVFLIDSETATARRKDRQGSLVILLVSELV